MIYASPPQYCHAPASWPLTFWPWKWLSESRVWWATCVPISVFLGFSVLELFPIYATERQTLTVAPIEGHHFDQHLLVCVYRQQNDFSTNVDHVGDDRLGDMSVMRYGYNLQLRFGLSSTRFFNKLYAWRHNMPPPAVRRTLRPNYSPSLTPAAPSAPCFQ